MARADSSVPPPPIEWPMKAWRPASIWLRTTAGDWVVSQVMAARIWFERAVGKSRTVLVLMVITTKPLEASRLAAQAWTFWPSVNPGVATMTPKVPCVVVVG